MSQPSNQCDQILELKVAQIPRKVAPKVAIAIFHKKLHVFKIAQKVT